MAEEQRQSGLIKAEEILSKDFVKAATEEVVGKLAQITPKDLTFKNVKGLAVDIVVRNSGQRYKILMGLIGAGFNRFGIGENFLHVDKDETKSSNVVWGY